MEVGESLKTLQGTWFNVTNKSEQIMIVSTTIVYYLEASKRELKWDDIKNVFCFETTQINGITTIAIKDNDHISLTSTPKGKSAPIVYNYQRLY